MSFHLQPENKQSFQASGKILNSLKSSPSVSISYSSSVTFTSSSRGQPFPKFEQSYAINSRLVRAAAHREAQEAKLLAVWKEKRKLNALKDQQIEAPQEYELNMRETRHTFNEEVPTRKHSKKNFDLKSCQKSKKSREQMSAFGALRLRFARLNEQLVQERREWKVLGVKWERIRDDVKKDDQKKQVSENDRNAQKTKEDVKEDVKRDVRLDEVVAKNEIIVKENSEEEEMAKKNSEKMDVFNLTDLN